MDFVSFLHHENWMYISTVIQVFVCMCVCMYVCMCVYVCVWCCTDGRELSGFLAESARLFFGASTCCCCLIDWHQRGVESPLDFLVCPGNWSED